MKTKVLILILILSIPVFSCKALAAKDALINAEPEKELSALMPGAIVLMPDGHQAVIMEQLANGDYLTDIGINISPLGLILDGEAKGQFARLDPEFYTASVKTEKPTLEIPSDQEKEPVNIEKPNMAKQGKTPVPVSRLPDSKAGQAGQTAQTTSTPVNNPASPANPKNMQVVPSEPENLTLAELLPMSNIKTGEIKIPQNIKELPEKKTEVPKKSPTVKKPENPKPETQKTAKAPAPKTKEAPKAQTPKKAQPKTGEEMKIPPEAIKSGNLDFLEGCWQGTRPEYYSKRIVKECFCFGTGGKSGKRRIYDHGRMCIGGTRASLSSKGILSVTSTGAACNDGERWGAAEMVCRNSGPKTPCSWIFRDANNGQQSYTIPFVRVESCGR